MGTDEKTENIYIRKKDNTLEKLNIEKIISAVSKSSSRVLHELTEEEKDQIKKFAKDQINDYCKKYPMIDGIHEIPVSVMHSIAEISLDKIDPAIAKSYRDYRDYKTSFVKILDDIYSKAQSIMYIGDRENANSDSALVSTKRSLIFNQLNKELYQRFQLDNETLQACKEGYIYVHDMSARRDSINCFSRWTRFITSTGIKSFYDFSDGDEVIVLTHKGNWKKAIVRQYGYQKLQKITFVQNVSNNRSKKKKVYATKNHRWILQDGSETTNISVGDKLISIPPISDFNGISNWRVKSIEPSYINGNSEVWCLEVEDDHSFVLEGGIPTGNCCLFNAKEVLKDGFEMGNVWYNEPKSLDTAFDVLGDIILAAASQQYGGFTIPRVDELLAKYANISYQKYRTELYHSKMRVFSNREIPADIHEDILNQADKEAMEKVERDFMQGFQGWEYKFNTVASSRGDYPFITITIGIGTSPLEKLATKCCLKVRSEGQGKPGHKRHVLFPKIVFTYTESLHGPGMVNEDLFEAGIRCSGKAMYPDWLSLDGDTHVAEMWHKYGEVVAPMGCVAGHHTIHYMIDGDEYHSNFEEFWYLMTNMETTKKQFLRKNQYIDPKNTEVKIFDPLYGFVNVKRIIRNYSKEWVRINLSNGQELNVTTDHPFPVVNKGRVYAVDLSIHDRIMTCEDVDAVVVKSESDLPTVEVSSIVYYKKADYSYDVTTDSDHFAFSGIYSHNCRAFLSAYYERGGAIPADDDDTPFFTGRFNIGAVSLHLPMILMKSKQENKDFYKVLDYYLELIRRVHIMTYNYLGEMRASFNPLGFCEGGFHGGHLKPTDKILPLLKYSTASFGVTALNELNRLYNGKSILEDGKFPLEVMEYINKKLDEYKKEDHINYAVYGTPAESLCATQVTQFRKKYGIVRNVSDRGYVSNSFHCHVSEDIDGITKQDKEHRFWNLFKGGRIQYVKYGVGYNLDAIRTFVRRAMKMGLYEGINLVLSYCEDCGHSENGMDVCPVCGSKNICKIERMNGYLAYSRVKGFTRLNDGKMEEIHDRKSM